MKYEVYKFDIKNQKRGERIKEIISFNWSDNINEMFLSFNFETTEKLSEDDWIELYSYTDRETVFYGRITAITNPENNFYQYSGYDYGQLFYIQDTTIQYNQSTLQDAIEQVCKKENIEFNIFNVNTINNIDKIYRDRYIQDIIHDIHKIAVENNLIEDKYYYECKKGKLNLSEYKEVERIQGYTGGRYRINSFEYVISVNKRTWNKKKRMEFQNGSSLKVYADYNLQSGIYTTIENEVLKMNGYYLVTSSKHSIKGGLEEVDVTLVKYEPVEKDNENL